MRVRGRHRWLPAALPALLLAACVAQQQPAPGIGVDAPLPPALQAALSPDRSCGADEDCAVRNVGNCCGYYPACVNKDARLDPAAVRDECARTGTSAVCGWPDIQACTCVQGQCQATTGPIQER